ncbi:MAG: DUF1624 domain-containing protein [Sporomusaceae bacterium]|nr:DUF1624 domain-containing protein [Sporomusaceae bacterium]
MNSSTAYNNRIWEIDFIRGIAIILMIVFHLIVDLKDFYAYNIDYLAGFWYLEGKLSAIIFILISGVSSTLGSGSLSHGSKVFAWGMFLTVVTYLYNPGNYILFGILHFLGISLLSASFMRRLPSSCLAMISCAAIALGILFSERFVSSPYLFPIGLISSTFISLDYYPIFPWYGVFLFGIIVGKIVCADKKRLSLRQASYIQSESYASLLLIRSIKLTAWLGQHSLAIYLIHQPILLALLYTLHLF